MTAWEASIRAGIRTVVASVTGIGQVHDYFRVLNEQTRLVDEYVVATDTGSKLHVWQISLSDDAPYTEERRPASRHALGRWKFSIHGHYGVDDANASEKAWAVLVELVLDAFRADKRLGNTVIDSGPPQWVTAGYRQISSHLCHYARIDLSVLVQVEP